MDSPNLTMAQQIALAASAFQEQRMGHAPKAVTVVLNQVFASGAMVQVFLLEHAVPAETWSSSGSHPDKQF